MKKSNLKLDMEEKKLSDSFDKNEWKSVKNLKNEIAATKKIAKNTLRKDTRINIRLSSSDIIRIK